MKLAFTIDFEDWYQGIGLPLSTWEQYEKRLHIGHYKLLNLLKKNNVKATYFILGKTIEDHPKLIQEIIDEGHEIACHSYSHPFLYQINEQQLKNELEKCKQLIEPFGVKYTGFRAPYFSIDTRNLWALNMLQDFVFTYDSSIFPGDTKRTGIPNFNPDMHQILPSLIEIPVSKFRLGPLDFGVGGAYFRILPYKTFKNKVANLTKERPTIFYIHPWELDPNHPKLNTISKRIKYTHYFQLNSTEPKLERLLQDFECCSMQELFLKK